MKNERATIELVVFRDDDNGATDMTAMWSKLIDALHQICGVDEVKLTARDEVLDDADDTPPAA